MSTINIAITGCGHGELDVFYRMCKVFEKKGRKIDLLIITGDFQATRNQEDLGCLKCPDRYRHMMDFYKYYNGERTAPILTIYVGGNHEAVNYHRELHYGGWVAPNIYYLGCSNVIRYKGLRIGALSGIWKTEDYDRGYYEVVPFHNENGKFDSGAVSSFHYRRLELLKLLAYPSPLDIMISHDWPSRIFNYGNTQELIRQKPFFQEEMKNMCLGSIPLMDVLNTLQPDYWFAAHLHVKYAALYPHRTESTTATLSEDQPQTETDQEEHITRFLALDKCVRGRDFIQVLEIPISAEYTTDSHLYYDMDWLAIVKESHRYESTSANRVVLPARLQISEQTQAFFTTKMEELEGMGGRIPIPENFIHTAPFYVGKETDSFDGTMAIPRGNNQTDEYLAMLGLEHTITIPYTNPAVFQQQQQQQQDLVQDLVQEREQERKEEEEDPNVLDIDDI